MRRVRSMSCLVLLALAFATPAVAEPVTAATWSENGHQYGVILAPSISWDAAAAAAAELEGGGWHLATITSEAEQQFIEGLSLSGREFWLGGIQAAGSSAASGWSWVTGESLGYLNWAPGEANDYSGAGSEQHLAMWGQSRTWNDEGNRRNISGFLIERSAAPVPEPGTMMLVGLAGGALFARRRRQQQSC